MYEIYFDKYVLLCHIFIGKTSGFEVPVHNPVRCFIWWSGKNLVSIQYLQNVLPASLLTFLFVIFSVACTRALELKLYFYYVWPGISLLYLNCNMNLIILFIHILKSSSIVYLMSTSVTAGDVWFAGSFWDAPCWPDELEDVPAADSIACCRKSVVICSPLVDLLGSWNTHIYIVVHKQSHISILYTRPKLVFIIFIEIRPMAIFKIKKITIKRMADSSIFIAGVICTN